MPVDSIFDTDGPAHRPVRYGVTKTDDGAIVTFVMKDGEEINFRLHAVDLAGLVNAVMKLYGEVQ